MGRRLGIEDPTEQELGFLRNNTCPFKLLIRIREWEQQIAVVENLSKQLG